MQNEHNFTKSCNTKNVISVLSSDYYNENQHFNEDFSKIAYVFVFSIVIQFIGICLFPSITPILSENNFHRVVVFSELINNSETRPEIGIWLNKPDFHFSFRVARKGCEMRERTAEKVARFVLGREGMSNPSFLFNCRWPVRACLKIQTISTIGQWAMLNFKFRY